MTNREWLTNNADAPIRYLLGDISIASAALLGNPEAAAWYARLMERSEQNNIGDIHGSHDYRMENILGKCSMLGLSKSIPEFAWTMSFITDYLASHTQMPPPDAPGFGRIYHYCDCEKVLACFLPALGYYDNQAVKNIVRRRIDILYEFTRKKRYDIYIDGSALKGVKKEWQPYIIDPKLYADGNIALPDMHDILLFAGMYPYLTVEDAEKVESITGWLFGEGYSGILRRYGYFYVPGGSYDAKAVIFKLHLIDFERGDFDRGDLASLLFNVYMLSFFNTARQSKWFSQALAYLDQYKTEKGRYKFPPYMITEAPDHYVIFGGHMNVGENRRGKLYGEIISTYWMERIKQNCMEGINNDRN